MDGDDQFAAMVDACLLAHATVAETGTAEMMSLARALLFLVGQEAARRASTDDLNSQNQEPSNLIGPTLKPYWE